MTSAQLPGQAPKAIGYEEIPGTPGYRSSDVRGGSGASASRSDDSKARISSVRAKGTGRRSYARWLIGSLALAPLVFMLPSVIALSSVAHESGNDVLGTGGALLLFLTLFITPLVMITGNRWFIPLRRWFGIVFAVDVIVDAVIAANDPAFGTSIVQDLTGHPFLLLGLIMVTISIPLMLTAGHKAQVYLGRWWKKLQKYGTYAIAALLGIHLALLEGFGFAQGDGFGVAHQRLYEYTACIIPLVVWRMPVVRRLYKTHNRIAWVLTAVLLAMFITGMTFFVNELVFKGYQAFTMHPVED